jgi:hypothetical protein
VHPRDGGGDIISAVADLGDGGIAFPSPRELPLESVVDVSLPIGDRAFSLAGSIASCQPNPAGGQYRIGVAFLHPMMSFRMKLAEQVLRIHELRREISDEQGRHVTTEEAAREWVTRHAEEFADIYSS